MHSFFFATVGLYAIPNHTEIVSCDRLAIDFDKEEGTRCDIDDITNFRPVMG